MTKAETDQDDDTDLIHYSFELTQKMVNFFENNQIEKLSDLIWILGTSATALLASARGDNMPTGDESIACLVARIMATHKDWKRAFGEFQ